MRAGPLQIGASDLFERPTVLSLFHECEQKLCWRGLKATRRPRRCSHGVMHALLWGFPARCVVSPICSATAKQPESQTGPQLFYFVLMSEAERLPLSISLHGAHKLARHYFNPKKGSRVVITTALIWHQLEVIEFPVNVLLIASDCVAEFAATPLICRTFFPLINLHQAFAAINNCKEPDSSQPIDTAPRSLSHFHLLLSFFFPLLITFLFPPCTHPLPPPSLPQPCC